MIANEITFNLNSLCKIRAKGVQVNFNLRSISMEKSKNNEVNDKVLQSTAESLNILDFFKKASPDYNGSNTEKQARINTLLKGLPLDVAEKVYVLIRL